MSSSQSRAEVIKPLLIKAGIPAALSVAAYISARIISKRFDSSVAPLPDHLQRTRSQPDSLLHQELKDEARDKGLLSNQREIERQANLIQELKDEVSQLKEDVDNLEKEKIELNNKLELAEKSDKIEIEGVTKDEYDEVLKELQQLQKDCAIEANELTYLRGSNACLRDELLRCHEQHDHSKGEINNQIVELEMEGNHHELDLGHVDEACLGTTGQVHSRQRRFILKLKKWVDGGKLDDDHKEKKGIRCFGRHSVSEDVGDQLVHARKSCSSV